MVKRTLETLVVGFLAILGVSSEAKDLWPLDIPQTEQPIEEGAVVENFWVYRHGSPDRIWLSDFAGQIVALDFFAHWCGPCRQTTPQLEEDVREYYFERGGNPQGIPVVVLPINVEPDRPGETLAFVQEFGLELVGEDFESDEAYAQFYRSALPSFALIYGVEGDRSMGPWELVVDNFWSALDYRRRIDEFGISLGSGFDAVRIEGSSRVSEGREVRLTARVSGIGPFEFQWWKNGRELENETSSVFFVEESDPSASGEYRVEIRRGAESKTSDSFRLDVTPRDKLKELVFQGRGETLAIPDANSRGVRVPIAVDDSFRLSHVEVEATVEHPFRGDLSLYLVAPNGAEVQLWRTVPDDDSEDLYVRREIDQLNNIDAAGEWNLRVVDNAPLDTGALRQWSLRVEGEPEATQGVSIGIRIGSDPVRETSLYWPGSDGQCKLQRASTVQGPWEDFLVEISGDQIITLSQAELGRYGFFRLVSK